MIDAPADDLDLLYTNFAMTTFVYLLYADPDGLEAFLRHLQGRGGARRRPLGVRLLTTPGGAAAMRLRRHASPLRAGGFSATIKHRVRLG